MIFAHLELDLSTDCTFDIMTHYVKYLDLCSVVMFDSLCHSKITMKPRFGKNMAWYFQFGWIVFAFLCLHPRSLIVRPWKMNACKSILSTLVNHYLGGGFKHFLLSPLPRGDFQIWLIFFKGVETTNQIIKPPFGKICFTFPKAPELSTSK